MNNEPRSRCLSRATAAIFAASLTVACGAEPDERGACSTGFAVSAASAEARKLIGRASRYPADLALPARAEALRRSQRARRAAAWEVVARVLAPVQILTATEVPGASLPRFRTWYDREDFARVFHRAFETLGAEGRRSRAPFREEALDEAFEWNSHFVDTLDFWPASRWDSYVASVHDGETLAGVPGIRRIALSPEAARHLVTSYAEAVRCVASGAPARFVDGASETSQRVERRPFSLSRCAAEELGPYFVTAGATIEARVQGDDATAVSLAALDGDGVARCRASGAQGCSLAGPGAFRVRVSSATRPLRGVVEVRHRAPEEPSPGCLRGAFPADAATVSMEWRRGDLGTPLPVYDTSAAAIERRLRTSSPTWGTGDSTAAPTGDSIYTVFLRGGAVFQLTGMHIRTRELGRWMYISIWWSPQPDSDFGADRPAQIRALGSPWDFYKMCVATDFDEVDSDAGGGFERDAPSLAEALRAVHEGQGGASWCSNPYIDAGPGLARSNCVGCHQHAMTGVRPAETIADERRFPSVGRRQVRNNYPSDQFWGLDTNDALESVFEETLAWWADADRR